MKGVFMKKTLLVLAAMSAMVLSSCGKKAAPGGSISYSDQVQINQSVIDDNFFIGPKEETEPNKLPGKFVEDFHISEDDLAFKENAATDLPRGFLPLLNDAGNVGFYSMIAGKFITGHHFVPAWLSYSAETVANIGFLLTIQYEDEVIIIDAFGNQILREARSEFYYLSNIETTIVNEKTYLSFNLSSLQFSGYLYFEYSAGGVASQVDRIPDPEPDPTPTVYNNYNGPKVGHLVDEGETNLKIFGLSGYKLSENHNVFRLYQGETLVNTFRIPDNANAIGIVNGKLFYAVVDQLPQRALEYQYSVGESKFNYQLYSLDLMNPKDVQERNYGVLVEGIRNILHFETKVYNDDGTIDLERSTVTSEYAYIAFDEINSDLTLGARKEYIMDSNFVMYDDLSGLRFNDFVKVDDDLLFNPTTKTLFNNKFEYITDLSGLDEVYASSYNRDYGFFMARDNGFYGLVNKNGKVVAPFIFDSFDLDSCDGEHIIGRASSHYYDDYEKGYYRVDINLGGTSFLDDSLSKVSANLYMDDENYYYTSAEDLGYLYTFVASHTVLGTQQVRTYYNQSFDDYPKQAYDFNLIKDKRFVIGSPEIIFDDDEVTHPTGVNNLDPQVAGLGENKFHKLANNDPYYFAFEAPAEGYYAVYLGNRVNSVNMTTFILDEEGEAIPYSATENITADADSTYYTGHVFFLREGQTLLARIDDDTSSQFSNIFIERADGTSSTTAFIVSDDSPINYVASSLRAIDKVYVRFSPSAAGSFKPTASISGVTIHENGETDPITEEQDFYYGATKLYVVEGEENVNLDGFEFKMTGTVNTTAGTSLKYPIKGTMKELNEVELNGTYGPQQHLIVASIHATEAGTYHFTYSTAVTGGIMTVDADGNQLMVFDANGDVQVPMQEVDIIFAINIPDSTTLEVTLEASSAFVGATIDNPVTPVNGDGPFTLQHFLVGAPRFVKLVNDTAEVVHLGYSLTNRQAVEMVKQSDGSYKPGRAFEGGVAVIDIPAKVEDKNGEVLLVVYCPLKDGASNLYESFAPIPSYQALTAGSNTVSVTKGDEMDRMLYVNTTDRAQFIVGRVSTPYGALMTGYDFEPADVWFNNPEPHSTWGSSEDDPEAYFTAILYPGQAMPFGAIAASSSSMDTFDITINIEVTDYDGTNAWFIRHLDAFEEQTDGSIKLLPGQMKPFDNALVATAILITGQTGTPTLSITASGAVYHDEDYGDLSLVTVLIYDRTTDSTIGYATFLEDGTITLESENPIAGNHEIAIVIYYAGGEIPDAPTLSLTISDIGVIPAH